MGVLRAAVVLGAALVAVSTGAANPGLPQQPVLTYAVSLARGINGGLCATDLNGSIFRISDPHDISGAQWSPDGSLIGYSRWDRVKGEDHLDDVVVTDAEGRHLINLTQGGGRGTFSVQGWSPHGHKLLIQWSGFYSSLSVLDLDNSVSRTLVGGQGYVGGGSWSPADRILFSMYSTSTGSAVYVIDADGTNQHKLLDSAFAPMWSPDGSRFAYTAESGNAASGVGVANADGSGAHILVTGRVGSPRWSPDGAQIAYLGVDTSSLPHSLEVVSADGGVSHVLAQGDLTPGSPAWSPDGSQIAFTRDTQHPRLVLIKPDGTGEVTVDTGGLPASGPTWRVATDLPQDRRPCVVYGTARADRIRGTDRGDLVYAGRGNDRIDGRGGDDVIVGGRGHDRLSGGNGDDVLRARDRTRDLLFGGAGLDVGLFDPVDRVKSIAVERPAR